MMLDQQTPFSNPAAIATYAADTPRKVPGLDDLHRMATLLLADPVSGPAHMLVVGAGGGLELKAMAEARAAWRFTGLDPSPAMLDLARHVTAPFADRITLVEGTIDRASSGPFDGATCLLVLHFLDREERLRTLREIHRRLKPGANLVVAHHAPPGGDRARWMALSAAFADRAALDGAKATATGKAMVERLPLLTPTEEEELLRAAGFRDVALFYAAFSFRGWVATAGAIPAASA